MPNETIFNEEHFRKDVHAFLSDEKYEQALELAQSEKYDVSEFLRLKATGFIFIQQQQYSKALPVLEQAFLVDPTDDYVNDFLVETFLYFENYSSAIFHLNKLKKSTSRLYGHNFKVYDCICYCYFSLGKTKECSNETIEYLRSQFTDKEYVNMISESQTRIIPQQVINFMTTELWGNVVRPLKSEDQIGVYVLIFENGEYYVGQTINMGKRLLQHRKKYNDIHEVFFRTVEVKENLIEEESNLISLFLLKGFRIRNLKEINLLTVFDTIKQERWLKDNKFNWCSGEKYNNEKVREKLHLNFIKLSANPKFQVLLACMAKYVSLTTPNYRATEYNFWAISCLPKYLKKSNFLSRININEVPVCSVVQDKETGMLQFMLVVSKLPFFEFLCNKREQELFDKYSSISLEIREAFGSTCGDELIIHIDENDFIAILDDDLFLSSIRLLNLKLMNGVGTQKTFVRSVSHCLDFADEIVKIAEERLQLY